MTTSHEYNTCKNKGNCRVWIEGQRLIDAGWDNGDRFNKAISEGVLTLVKVEDGRHKVAGTPARPIIDLNGKYLNPLLEGAPRYRATFASPRLIVIEPIA